MADGTDDNANLQNLASIQLQGVKNLGLIIQAILNTFPNFVPPPALATSPGTPNQVAFDSGFFYICIATNSWKRVAISTF